MASGNTIESSKIKEGLSLTRAYRDNVVRLLEPLSNMLFQSSNDGSLHIGDTEISLRDIPDLRKSIEGSDYDLKERFNNKKYSSDVEDPITNLSGKDKTLLRSILSAATNSQLVNVKVQPYVNKSTLLIVYAALALVLVPVAH